MKFTTHNIIRCVRPAGSLKLYSGPGGTLYKVLVAIPGGIGAQDRVGAVVKDGVIVREVGTKGKVFATVWDQDRFHSFLPKRARRERIAASLGVSSLGSAVVTEFWKQVEARRTR